MSTQTPPRLLELAGRSLLRAPALAIPALEDLPRELFPPLFTKALARRHTEILQAMVQAWPFPCLPLGSLMRKPHLETLAVALDGLDMLLAQKVRPSRCKLQVVDLRKVPQHFCSVRCGATESPRSPEATRKRQTVTLGQRTEAGQPLRVLIDLSLRESTLHECQAYVLLWAKQRADSLHLCCQKLRIFAKSIHIMRKVLEMLDLSYIQEVEVHCPWELGALAAFAPYLGQMRNLRKLLLFHVHVSASASLEEEESLVTQFTSQLPRMDRLQKLCVDAACFLEGRLAQVLRCLQSRVETLSIINCPLSGSDLEHLSCWANTGHLKHLDLRGTELTGLSPEPLRALLDRAAATLETLDLEVCDLEDPQLQAILPALSRCSQLRTIGFYGNRISMAVLKALLRHTARLSQLRVERYPAPLESYDARGAVCLGRLSQLCAELMATLRDLRQPKLVFFVSVPCLQCGYQAMYNLGLSPCRCPMPA